MFVSKFDTWKQHLKLYVQGKIVVLNENSVEGKPCINRKGKSLELTILSYLRYDEHESLGSCYTAVYVSWLEFGFGFGFGFWE